ncbi:MAG TPA: MFS transporter [Xanthobacteraceae bacterium]
MDFVLRLALLYAGVFVAMGIQMPFLPVWLAAKGLDERAIGAALAAYSLARVAAIPFVTHAADRFARLHTAILIAAAGTALSFTLLGLAQGQLIFAALIVAGIAAAATLPLVEAYALHGLATRGRAYGPVRLWGSAAYIIGNIAAGLISTVIAPVSLIWPLVAVYWASVLTALGMRPLNAAPARRVATAGWRNLFGVPGLIPIVAAASLIQASHSLYYGFSTLQWSAGGLDGPSIGALWAVGVIAEIVLFAASPRLPGWASPAVLIVIGAAGGIVRWTAMAFDPPGTLLPVLQCLHALSFGTTHLGAVQFLTRAAPAGSAASAQGFLATVMGVVSAGSMAVSGALFAAYGAHAYVAMALLAFAGGAVALAAGRRGQPQSAGSGG